MGSSLRGAYEPTVQPNTQMEPSRQTVLCDHVTAARGSFATLDGQDAGSSPVTPTVVGRRSERGRRGPEGVPQLADRGGEFLKLAR